MIKTPPTFALPRAAAHRGFPRPVAPRRGRIGRFCRKKLGPRAGAQNLDPTNPKRVLHLGALALALALTQVAQNSGRAAEATPNAAPPALLTPEQIAAGWISLFDGQTLFGWQPTSDADWTAADGEIRVTKGAQGWLMTTSDFADYELHVEFQSPATTNSGIFLRTPLEPTDPAKDCFELNIAPRDNPFPTASLVGRLKVSTAPEGYTVDSPTERTRRTGGPSQEIDAWDGQWHAFDVVVEGATVRIALDGVLLNSLVVEPSNPATPTRGRIGLQYREGPVAFRNIRLRPLELDRLLKRNDLTGWRTDEVRDAMFDVIEPEFETSGSLPLEGREHRARATRSRPSAGGTVREATGEGGEAGARINHPSLTLPIEGRGPEGPNSGSPELHVSSGPGELETEDSFGDFILQLECRVDGDGLNSGVFFRSIPGQFANGYESQIQNAVRDGDPTKPVDFGTGAIYRRVAARRVVSKDREWFAKTIVATGPHIAVWVNGYQVTDWTDDRPPHENPRNGRRLEPGTISVQAHDPTTNLRFRNLRIAELPKTD